MAYVQAKAKGHNSHYHYMILELPAAQSRRGFLIVLTIIGENKMINNKTLLLTLLTTTALTLSNAYATCVNDQTCGTNCCWNLTDGVLSISTDDKSTSGMMDDALVNSTNNHYAPWHSQGASITSVVIEGADESTGTSGITNIGNGVFVGCPNLTSVTIPDSVTSIGQFAFSKATGLTSVNIPDTVTSIGHNAFYGTTSLTSVRIPNSLTNIAASAFTEANIQNLTISDQLSADLPNLALNFIDGGEYQSALNDVLYCAPEYPNNLNINIGDFMCFYDLPFYLKNLEQRAADLRAKTNSIQINCEGDIEVCKSKLTVPDSYKAVMGDDWVPFNITQSSYTRKNSDGSTTVYDANNKTTSIYDENVNLISLKGKRIYTIEEANALTKPTGNTVRIKYR